MYFGQVPHQVQVNYTAASQSPSNREESQSPTLPAHKLDTETSDRLLRANRNASEYLNLLANEPSVGLYHVQTHIQKSVPKIVNQKKDVNSQTKQVTDAYYDLDFSAKTIKELQENTTFSNINQLLTDSMKMAEEVVKRGFTYSGSKLLKSPSSSPSSSPLTFSEEVKMPSGPRTDSNEDLKPKTF